MGTTVVETLIPCEGQFTRGIHIATEHAGQRFTGLRTDEPSLHDRRHLVGPRHSHSITGDVHKNNVFVYFDKGFNQCVLTVWQSILLAVMTLTVLIVALVQTTEYDDIVGTLGLLYSLRQQLVGTASFGNATAHCDAIVALNGIADVAAGVVN